MAEPTEIATATLPTATSPLTDSSPAPPSPTSPTSTAPRIGPAPSTPTPPAPSPPDPPPIPSGPFTDLPTLGQIQLGTDGTYFVADRGDGCRWEEFYRSPSPDIGVEVFFRTECEVDFGFMFRPATGEILIFLP